MKNEKYYCDYCGEEIKSEEDGYEIEFKPVVINDNIIKDNLARHVHIKCYNELRQRVNFF